MADKQNLAKKIDLNAKQDILIAGQNITIAADGKTISAANPTSVTVTPVYQAGTLVAAIIVNGNTTNIYAPAQHGDNANQNLALSFSAAQTYEVGDFVIYQENLYKCITAIDTPAAWDSTKWMRALITDEMGQGSGGDYANQNIANTYDTTATYDVGDYVIYDGLLYKCITAVTTPGLWNATYWERCIVTDEMGSGGGLDLPDNWTWDEEALTAFGFVPKNSLGWGVGNTTYYTDTQMTWDVGGRSFTRDNAIPALIAYVVHDGWNGTICVSTDAEATHFSWNSQEYGPYEYMGYSWYLSGMNYSMTYNWHSDNINYLGSYSGSQGEKMVHDIIDASNLNSMTDQFISIMEPGSGILFAGGGEETDLSDATFKVTSNGGVYGTEFYKNGVPIGGGGGNVDDVYVNGQSVLDANKIAQITNYVELTQAEYDALPATKLTDGVLYCIKDQATADTTVAPIIYSEEEREVGVWTDGKPLYQKTFYYSTLNVSRTDWTILEAFTLDKFIDASVSFTNNTRYLDETYMKISYYNGNLYYHTPEINGTCNDVYITIQYTKTTDQPGSGKYAPSGVPAVHYSENEQVVGTWVDGSTIYERTFNVEYLTSSTKSIAHGINNLGHIVQIYGYVTNNTYNFPMPYVTTDAASCIGITVDATNINIISINRNDYYGYVTIRYTKSTT